MLMTDYTAKLLNLEDVIITNVENVLDRYTSILNYLVENISAPAVGLRRTVCTTIVCRL